jgi:hypothetical protein
MTTPPDSQAQGEQAMTDQTSAGEHVPEIFDTESDLGSTFYHLRCSCGKWDDFQDRDKGITWTMHIGTATAEAKLAGELAGREQAVKWLKSECAELGDNEPCHACELAEDVGRMPLTPDSAGVLERIKRAERAWGAEGSFRQCAKWLADEPDKIDIVATFNRWAAEQAAIADGKGDEDG